MICGLSCGFADLGSGRLLDRGALALTVADPCIWHGCGTSLSRRKSATTAGAPTGQARVCLAVPRLASTTLPVSSTRARHGGRHVMMAPEPLAWEAAYAGPVDREAVLDVHLAHRLVTRSTPTRGDLGRPEVWSGAIGVC